jgi:UDP:flavonoid glycosyltransferase YjiC (YdhE family)
MAYDQLDNGQRLVNLGVAEIVRQRSFTPRRVTAALQRLLESPGPAESARHWGSQCNGPAALARAATLLEELHDGAALRSRVAANPDAAVSASVSRDAEVRRSGAR